MADKDSWGFHIPSHTQLQTSGIFEWKPECFKQQFDTLFIPTRSATQPQGVPMTSTTIRVVTYTNSKDFDGPTAERDALEWAQEQAHQSNATVYLTRAFKVVKPKREVTVEDVTY